VGIKWAISSASIIVVYSLTLTARSPKGRRSPLPIPEFGSLWNGRAEPSRLTFPESLSQSAKVADVCDSPLSTMTMGQDSIQKTASSAKRIGRARRVDDDDGRPVVVTITLKFCVPLRL
jgi:hypothetical protein